MAYELLKFIAFSLFDYIKARCCMTDTAKFIHLFVFFVNMLEVKHHYIIKVSDYRPVEAQIANCLHRLLTAYCVNRRLN